MKSCRVENCDRERLPDSGYCRQHLREVWKTGRAAPVVLPEWRRKMEEANAGRGRVAVHEIAR